MKSSFKKYYDSKVGIKEYSELLKLQEPEKVILKKIKSKIKGRKMLDIGIGAGRTTKFFAPLVKEYVGTDYSKGMLDISKERFSNLPNASFKICDARAMRIFKDNSFDFILFSFNGIDSVSYEDRDLILEEIKRVGKKNAIFCFSSHNLLNLVKGFTIIPPKTKFLRKIKLLITRKINLHINESFEEIQKKSFAVIDLFVKGSLLSYACITPLKQIEQLKENSFKEIEAYSLKTGKKLNKRKLKDIKDCWVYYLCKIGGEKEKKIGKEKEKENKK